MQDVQIQTYPESAYAMYIAIAPRDPRESGASLESDIEYLEPVTQQELADALTKLSVPAQVIDGTHVGARGWVLARTIGVAEGRAPRWAPEENVTEGAFPTIEFGELASELAQTLNSACHVADHPNVPSTHAHLDGLVVDINRRSSALLGKFRSTDGPLLAHVVGDDLWFHHSEPWSIVASEDQEAYLENVQGWGNNHAMVLFERSGVWRRFTLMKGDFVGVHEWGPEWTNVDPRANVSEDLMRYLMHSEMDPAQFVFDFFERPLIDPRLVARAFELDEVRRSRLELVFNSPAMDDPFTAVSRILDLPLEGAEVAEGWRDIADLPGASLIEHQPFQHAVWASATTLPSEQNLSAKLMRLWLRRPAAYYALNAAEVALLGALTSVARKRGKNKTAFALGVATAFTFADFFVPAKWRGQNNTEREH